MILGVAAGGIIVILQQVASLVFVFVLRIRGGASRVCQDMVVKLTSAQTPPLQGQAYYIYKHSFHTLDKTALSH